MEDREEQRLVEGDRLFLPWKGVSLVHREGEPLLFVFALPSPENCQSKWDAGVQSFFSTPVLKNLGETIHMDLKLARFFDQVLQLVRNPEGWVRDL